MYDRTPFPDTASPAATRRATRHVRHLQERHPDLTTETLARLAGVHPDQITHLLEGGTITAADTYRLIKTAHLGPIPLTPRADCTSLPTRDDTRCRCSVACRSKAALAQKKRRQREDEGKPGMIEVSRCAERMKEVRALQPASTLQDFSDASGVSPATLRTIRDGRADKVRRSTAERIFAVRPADLARATDQRLVDPTPARQWVEELVALGWSRAHIARQAGVAERATLGPTAYRREKRITADVARRLWAVRQELDYVNPATIKKPLTVQARVKARRQVDALYAMGWSRRDLRERFGISSARLGALADLTNHQTDVSAIEEAYTTLSPLRGDANDTRARAKVLGYVPPLAWEEGTISDPTATPDFLAIRETPWRRRARARYKDPALRYLVWAPPIPERAPAHV